MKTANISENSKTKKINEKIMDVLIKIFVKEYKNGEEIEIELNADLISEKIIELEEDL